MKNNISLVKKCINLIITDILITLKSGLHSIAHIFTKTKNDIESFSKKLDLLHLGFITKDQNVAKKYDYENNINNSNNEINDDTNNLSFLIKQNQSLYIGMSQLLAEKEVERLKMINIKKRLTDLESKICLDKSLKCIKGEYY